MSLQWGGWDEEGPHAAAVSLRGEGIAGIIPEVRQPRIVLALVVLGAAAWVAKVTLEYEAAKSDAAGQFGGRR